MKTAAVMTFASILLAGTLHASEAYPPVDAKILSVQAAGSWQNETGVGSYRVVYWSEGFEHVSTGVVVEWIAESGDPNEPARVVRSKMLVSPGMLSLATPTLLKKKNAVRVILKGAHTYSMQKVSCEFELAHDAKIKTIKDCG